MQYQKRFGWRTSKELRQPKIVFWGLDFHRNTEKVGRRSPSSCLPAQNNRNLTIAALTSSKYSG
jgi:hypothetical protein